MTIPAAPEMDRPAMQSREWVDKAQRAIVEPCCTKPLSNWKPEAAAQGVLVDQEITPALRTRMWTVPLIRSQPAGEKTIFLG